MSLHINDDAVISKIVLMPGDPKRCEFIAKKYLTDIKVVNEIRGMTAFTGYYKEKQISIVPSGMGMPSMGIYAYELYNDYNVDVIIRIGTCGTFSLNVLDLIIAKDASTLSNFAYEYDRSEVKISHPSKDVNDIILNVINSKDLNGNVINGRVFTTDVFYKKDNTNEKQYDGIEMETFALFYIAEKLNKKAASILTVSDVIGTKSELTKLEREQKLIEMIEIALDTTLNL